MNVRKAVILAAGFGTRMLPATKAQPKEMLPLVDKPIIQYVMEEVVRSGIETVVIVTAANKRAVEDHFDRSHELERILEQRGDQERLEEVRRISEMAAIVYVRQLAPLGIGDAVLRARPAIGDEPFVLAFPDDVVDGDPPATRQLLDVFESRGASVVAVERVPKDEISAYGVVSAEPLDDGVFRVRGLVEKPEPDEAPSDLGIVGRYLFTPTVFDVLAETPAGKGGEVQITDAMAQLLAREPLYCTTLSGRRYDTGRPLGLLQASVELALRREDIGPEFRRYLRRLVSDSEAS